MAILMVNGTRTHAKNMNKIILADNQAIFRAGAAKILAREGDFRIVAQCLDSDRLHQTIDAFPGAVVIFAAALISDLKTLMDRVASAGSRAIAILEKNDLPQPFLSAGVEGLVYRSATGSLLLDCARRVAKGGRFQQPPEEDEVGARVRDRLTAKEMEVVALITQGRKNKEIAARLGISEQVVKNYLGSIYDKTGVSDRLELALFTEYHEALAEAAAAVGDQMMGIV